MASLIHSTDRIFVAGHRGMAGSAICRALNQSGYQNLLTATRAELDLEDGSAVMCWFKQQKPTVVVLAAARVGGIHANNTYPADFLLENLKIQTNVIESAWRCGVRRLLFLASSCIYPKFAEQPIREEALLSSALEPTNQWYAIAKIAGVKLCSSLRKQYGFDAISLMPTNLYGPGDRYHPDNSHVVASLIRRFCEAKVKSTETVTCWGTGSPLREFLHVDDLATACVFTLEKWNPIECEENYLNVGTGSDITIKQLAELIAKSVNFKGEIIWDATKPDGTHRKLLDITKIRNLGWSHEISAEEGIAMTACRYLEDISSDKKLLSASIFDIYPLHLPLTSTSIINENKLADFFNIIHNDPTSIFFRPHPLSSDFARCICKSITKDYYVVLVDLSKNICAYGMLRGWEEGWEIPSLGIYVAPNSRGRGASNLLMMHLHKVAKQRGASKIRLKVNATNLKAYSLYKRFGYVFECENENNYIGFMQL